MAAVLDVEGAVLAARGAWTGIEGPVPCWFCCGASFWLCVFEDDGCVGAGSTLTLLADGFVVGVRCKSKSSSDLWRSVSCGELFESCCCVVDEGKGAGEPPAVRISGA